jgi:hypothetical protein
MKLNKFKLLSCSQAIGTRTWGGGGGNLLESYHLVKVWGDNFKMEPQKKGLNVMNWTGLRIGFKGRLWCWQC